MAHITIVTPAGAGTRTGNRHTAQRWARLLRTLGHRVSVCVDWDGRPADLLLALHARRSHASVEAFARAHPGRALVVALTGTDLYRDLPGSRDARRSLALATRIIVLQDDARRLLAPALRRRTRVVYQSSDARPGTAPPRDRFRVAVVGHLREEKDPFRAVQALASLSPALCIEVVQVGDAMTPAMAREARAWVRREPRYRWIGGRAHGLALGWIARSHLLVVSSVMEGGANVICEAARIGTPVVASRISGNLGMLGRDYPGFYPLGDARALARRIARAAHDAGYRARLKAALRARRARFAPRAERAALAAVIDEALATAHAGLRRPGGAALRSPRRRA
ncbi:MAG TPA: selenoneine biosynthesis selenosugar synthase SenB [Burkholderiales bacterium]|nr:selenoneine biosynthesis selenosugar synthase SenB [Burkholderiales bacterium]